MDYTDARRRMVDGQLRPNRVTDPRLLDAMRTLPREEFLPPALRSRAYADEDVPLPGGRSLMEPMVIARLLQLAEPRPGDRGLVVCAGTGYGAAVLGHIGVRVIALEADPALARLAKAALAATLPAGRVRLEQTDPTGGHPAGAPYDVILIEGEVPEIPAAIIDQLAEGGRLVAVQDAGGRQGRAVLGRRLGGVVTLTPAFDCATAALPAFAPAPSFVF
ncbi:protein-L-isoaspartate O-methyltransferase [Siccirubricoccus deserti]|uniref:Protein-L-isoaspartate O-methyltransferase n=1 Tax=Siccirubricoccus deserti TaxID=2013562 RepID=A0A9X0UJA9_9PROT|nr:protein-L-isoaspartate O-methyltransferase [Siccirubricoccus deserti]MBC4017920.1 protein-L-isoaspartate O-methyltransferase [Siccirubricoccus deserti]GGC61528.1 protein-L-isoaspartate O-methyltransferase [Siccirubricoccus deserti]